jgi:hypothetical protein
MNELLERIGFNHLTFLPESRTNKVISHYRREHFFMAFQEKLNLELGVGYDFTNWFWDNLTGSVFYNDDSFWNLAESSKDFGKVTGLWSTRNFMYRYNRSVPDRLGMVENTNKAYHIRGSFVKRFSTLFMSFFSIPLPDSVKTWVGNEAVKYCGGTPSLLFDIVPFIGWEAGVFHEDSGSCWWPKRTSSMYAEYGFGRLIFESMMPRQGFAIRFFQPAGPTVPTNPYGLSTFGRIMCLYGMPDMLENEFIVFNGYSMNRNKTQPRDYAAALAQYLDYPAPIQVSARLKGKLHDLCYGESRAIPENNITMYNRRPELFFNGGSAYLISPYPDRQGRDLDFEWQSELSNIDMFGLRQKYFERSTGDKDFCPEWWTDTVTGESYSSHEGVWRVIYDRPPKSADDAPSFTLRHFNSMDELAYVAHPVALADSLLESVIYVANETPVMAY